MLLDVIEATAVSIGVLCGLGMVSGMALMGLYDNNMWFFKKPNALKSLVTADLDNEESKTFTEHLYKYYKPHQITPELIAYFEEKYPKVLAKEKEKREKEKRVEQEFENLYQEFSVVQRMNQDSLIEVQELGSKSHSEKVEH